MFSLRLKVIEGNEERAKPNFFTMKNKSGSIWILWDINTVGRTLQAIVRFQYFCLKDQSMTLNNHLAMYSTDDLALIFNCSSRHIRRLVFRGDFPKPVKLGRLSRWPRPTFEHWFTEKVGLPDMQGELAK